MTRQEELLALSTTKLQLEHDAIRRLVTLPGAKLWPNYQRKIAEASAIHAELQRRQREQRMCKAIASGPSTPYPWCREPDACSGKGYCTRNPNCGE